MLGLFSGKSDHPLADPKSARELFERLGNSEPLDVIDEIDSWLESLGHEEEIKPQRRVDALFQLDTIGTAAARKLAREYLLLAGGGHGQHYKLWQANRKYWQQLASSYRELLGKCETDKKLREDLQAVLPSLQLRLLRAYGACLKWDQFRYGPLDPELWLGAGGIYLQAEKHRWLDKKQTLGDGMQTTIAAEYLRMLLFHAASMDRLQPLEIELAEQLLGFFLPDFSLTAQVRPENVYWVDAAKPLPPTRLARLPEITPTLRFFATADALAAIEAVRGEVQATGAVPKALGLTQQFAVPAVIAVLQHLAAFCAPQPPMRSHARHQVRSWMAVVSGFQAAAEALHGAGAGGGSWAVEDVSRGGMRAQVTLSGNDGLGIGALVAMRPDGGDNWLIGIVRRISRESTTQGNVGIETVGKSPCAVRFDSSGIVEDGLLLEAVLKAGDATEMVVSPGIWRDAKPLSFGLNGGRYRLRPLDELRRGSDYVIGRYWVDSLPA